MLKYIIKRILWIIPILIGVTIVVFTILYFSPGDPAYLALGDNATPEAVEAYRIEMGINGTYWERLGRTLLGLFQGDLGISYRSRTPVLNELLVRFSVTFNISAWSIVLGIILGIFFGIVAALKQNTILDSLCTGCALFGISMPMFWQGLMLILIFSEGVWKKLTIILPVLLIGMQLAGLVSTAVTTDFSQETKLNVSNDTAEAEAFVSDKGIFELSSKDNILVFILDRLDGKYIDSVVADDPHFFDDMEGFTYFPNNTSLYCRTYPADLYLLTGKISYYDQPANELFTQAYSEGRFLPSLRARDYTTKLYIAKYYAYSDVSQLQGLADNVVTEKQEQKVDKLRMLQAMAQFSAYRYTPHAMKQYFWLSAQTFSDTVVITNENKPYAGDSYRFGDELKKKGVSLTEEKNNFMFLHLKGCHGNYDLDAQGNYVGDGNSTLLEQTKGYFTLLKQYMEQMKALGVYDSSTIIITGDHGKSEDVRSLDTYKTTGLFVKPAGSSSGTLQTSSRPLSQTNFHATVLQAAGINSDEYGKSIWEVGEEEDVVRRFLYKVNKKALEEYEIRGDAEDFSNWTHVKDYPLTYDH